MVRWNYLSKNTIDKLIANNYGSKEVFEITNYISCNIDYFMDLVTELQSLDPNLGVYFQVTRFDKICTMFYETRLDIKDDIYKVLNNQSDENIQLNLLDLCSLGINKEYLVSLEYVIRNMYFEIYNYFFSENSTFAKVLEWSSRNDKDLEFYIATNFDMEEKVYHVLDKNGNFVELANSISDPFPVDDLLEARILTIDSDSTYEDTKNILEEYSYNLGRLGIETVGILNRIFEEEEYSYDE